MKKLGVFIPIFLTIVLAFSLVPNVSAITTTISPTSADTYINSDSPTTNYGTSTNIYVGHAPAPPLFRSLVKFDLSSIPSGSTINKATLYLLLNYGASTGDPTNPSETWVMHRITKDWTESEATWNSAKSGDSWSTAGGDFDAAMSSSTTGSGSGTDEWFSWDVTNIVSYWITQGNPNYGFLIKDIIDSGPPIAVFNSKEQAGIPSPYLEIEYGRGVGGIYAPIDKLNILAPYIALVGLIGAISTIFVMVKKRKD